jgi:hypothetical protein
MPVPRAAHAAIALLDGRVLLIGGCVEESCEAGPQSATVDAYDPSSRRFTRLGQLLDRRLSAVAMPLPSGEILIAGGWVGPHVSPLVEAFDPALGRSRRLPALSVARADIAAVRLEDGRILLAGGYDGEGPVDLVEIFDPSKGTVAPAGRLSIPRAGAGGALLANGQVLLVGGATEGRRPTAAAELFDPASGRSTPVGSLAQARYKHAVVGLRDSRVLVIGGSDHRDAQGKLRSIEVFDPTSNSFRSAGQLLEPRFKIPATVLLLGNGKVLIAGGAGRAELYDPGTARSAYVGPDIGKPLNFATATLLPDGNVLLAGGYDERGIRMSSEAWLIAPGPTERATKH